MDIQWKILLIGGSSATGKSYLSRQLSTQLGIPLIQVDDIRIALQNKVKPSDFPNLFFFLENKDFLVDFPTDVLVSKLEEVGNEIWPALNALIDKHLACEEPVIFEGDSILPALLTKRDQDQLKTIFIYDEKENIARKELLRWGGKKMPTHEQQIEFSYQYGQKIKRQAEECGYKTIIASPMETLTERVMELIRCETCL